MPPILRPAFTWFAMLCLAGSSLLPLAAWAGSGNAQIKAMAICGTSANAPLSPAAPNHRHCPYCSSAQQLALAPPNMAVAARHTALRYPIKLTIQHGFRLRQPLASNRARAPPA